MCVLIPQPIANFIVPHDGKAQLSFPEHYKFQFHKPTTDRNNVTGPCGLKAIEPVTLTKWREWLEHEETALVKLVAKAPYVCLQAWEEGPDPMRSLQLAVEMHRTWQIYRHPELWKKWYEEKEKNPDFQFLSGIVSLSSVRSFCQIQEQLVTYPMELVNRDLKHATLQPQNRYMVQRSVDLFAFYEYDSFWTSNPESWKKELLRRELKLKITDKLPDMKQEPNKGGKKPAPPKGVVEPPAPDQKAAAKKKKPPETEKDPEKVASDFIDGQRDNDCQEKGCMKRIETLKLRLQKGFDEDEWFQRFQFQGLNKKQMMKMCVGVLWHTANKEQCSTRCYKLGARSVIPMLKKINLKHFELFWKEVPEEVVGWYEHHENSDEEEAEGEGDGEDEGQDEEEGDGGKEDEGEDEGKGEGEDEDMALSTIKGTGSRPAKRGKGGGTGPNKKATTATVDVEELSNLLVNQMNEKLVDLVENSVQARLIKSITTLLDSRIPKDGLRSDSSGSSAANPEELKAAITAGVAEGLETLKNTTLDDNAKLREQNSKVMTLAFKQCHTSADLLALVEDLVAQNCLSPAKAVERAKNRLRSMRDKGEKDQAAKDLADYDKDNNTSSVA